MSAVEDLGGAVAAIEQGFQKNEIEKSAYRIAQEIDSGERIVVGVNRFALDEEDPYEPLRVDPAIEAAAGRAAGRGCAPSATTTRSTRHLDDAARRGRGQRQRALPDEGGARRARHRRRGLQRAARRLGRLPTPRRVLTAPNLASRGAKLGESAVQWVQSSSRCSPSTTYDVAVVQPQMGDALAGVLLGDRLEQLGLGVAGGVEVRHEGLVDHAESFPDRLGVVQRRARLRRRRSSSSPRRLGARLQGPAL